MSANFNKWLWRNDVASNCYHKHNKWPKISIVTPSYNQGQFIEETILSVLNQNYPNLEYIIIDGGSTDNTIDIIKKYDSYITYWVSEKDRGQADAINKGLSRTTGEILNWINSDDIFLPNAFYTVARVFMSNDSIDFCYGNRVILDASSTIVDYHFLPPYKITNSGYALAQETMFWRRRLMDRVGFLDSKLNFAMDFEFFLRFFKNGKGKKLTSFLGGFRVHEDHKSNNIMHVGYEESYLFWERLFPGLPHYYLKKQSIYSLVINKFRIITNPNYRMVLGKVKLMFLPKKSQV